MARAPWEITREMFLSIEEVDSLLAFVRGKTDGEDSGAGLDRLIIEVLLFSGLRNSEFCRLTLADVVALAIQPTLQVARREGLRPVHIPRSTAELINEYCTRLRPHLLPNGVDAEDPAQPLIFHEGRRPFERTRLYRRVVRILSAAGLGERASVQLLRHTYGYLAYRRSGGNLLFVQRQLGHAHPMITSIYAQFVEESYADLAERVGTPPAVGEATADRKPATEGPRWTSAVEEFESEYD